MTAAPAIGEYVSELFEQMFTGESGHASASVLGVTEAANAPTALLPAGLLAEQLPSVPSLGELAEDYRQRGDGMVELWGRPHSVTHPIASFGMETTRLEPGAGCL